MAIEVTTIGNDLDKKYPKLKILNGKTKSDGTIVLFYTETTGTVLLGIGDYENEEGQYQEGFTPFSWDDYDSPLILQNK